MNSRLKLLVAAVLLSLTLSAGVARACPMCADSLPSEADAKAAHDAGLPDNPSGASSPQLAEGFYYSILLMLVIPYTLLGAGGVMIYLKLKKAAEITAEREAQASIAK